MSGMKVAVGEGIARGPSVDLDGASLDAVQALGVGDQVLSFNKDLAVLADGDGAGTHAQGEGVLGFDEQGVWDSTLDRGPSLRGSHVIRRRPDISDAPQDHGSPVLVVFDPAQDAVVWLQSDWRFRSAEEISADEPLLVPSLNTHEEAA